MTPAKKRRLPKLPTEVFSLLGPVPVTIVDTLIETDDALGVTRFQGRLIDIEEDASRETQWQTLAHEMVHIALWDGAAHQQLTNDQLELVCDALGTYIAAAVQAGFIKITVPKET